MDVLDFTRMRDVDASPPVYRFGSFELDQSTGELRKRGIRVRLQDQPLQILVLLLEHNGELVTREQIQEKLWARGTYVDYDNAINSAMRRLREALGDDHENPRFIETFARRGYRFIGSLETPPDVNGPNLPELHKPVAKPGWRIRYFGLGGLLLLVIASLGIWWVVRSRPEKNATSLNPVPLTAAAGWESEPSFSPDGTQVAYVWDEGAGPESQQHIFVKLIGGGAPIRLTSGPVQDRSPAWSQDGRSIAFLRGSGAVTSLYLMPALGGAERKIADGYFALHDLFTRRIAWSPDGRFLAVGESKSLGAPTYLSLINVETGERVRLTTPPEPKTSDINPVFSPDGCKLLFTRCVEAKCGLYVLQLARDYRAVGNPISLKQEGWDIEGAVWTHDGKDILYSVFGADENASIMRVRAKPGAQPLALTFAHEVPFWPFGLTISPRGNRLAFTEIHYYAQIGQVRPGKATTIFSPSTRLEVSPQYSPDGKQVVFASNKSGVVEIWTCNADGSNSVQVTHFGSGFSGSPRWSPDGRSIAFDHEGNRGWRIFVTATDGSDIRKLTLDDRRENIPSWSADGNWIYYTSNQTGRFEIWKAHGKGGKGIQVTRNGGYTAFESPDGQSLYYTKSESAGLWKLSLQGGKEEQILGIDVGRDFAVTRDGIYYIPVHRPQHCRLCPVPQLHDREGTEDRVAQYGCCRRRRIDHLTGSQKYSL